MIERRYAIVWLTAFTLAALVTACGGGGGGDSVGGSNTYTIGGDVTGLAGTGLVLQDNGGNDLSISASGAFTFSSGLANGANYVVTVKTQPSGQTCTVNNGSGTLSGANVTSVSVICSATAYTVGGAVSGLTGSGLALQDNGGDNLAISGNGSFTFAAPVANGANYVVTVKTQPSGQTCTVNNGSGTISGANVASVSVSCSATSYTVGGAVTGLTGSGLTLQNNGADNLSISGNGTFTFATPVASGANYVVTVKTQPSGQTCTVNNGSGTLSGANVTNVSVACSASAGGSLPNRYTGSFTDATSSALGNVWISNGAVTFLRDDAACAAAGVWQVSGNTACYRVESVSYTYNFPAMSGCTVTPGSHDVSLSNTPIVDSYISIDLAASTDPRSYMVMAGWSPPAYAVTINCGGYSYSTTLAPQTAFASVPGTTTGTQQIAGSTTVGSGGERTYTWSLNAAP